jgi:hypothetical protein
MAQREPSVRAPINTIDMVDNCDFRIWKLERGEMKNITPKLNTVKDIVQVSQNLLI